MKSFVFAATVGVASALHASEIQYMNYLAKFGKIMETIEEFDERLENFIKTDKLIDMINEHQNSWVAGHNQFSDWHEHEYKGMLGYIAADENAPITLFSEDNTPDSVNWVDGGAVTPVKDQGQCGSCWSFSTTGSMEGAHFKATGKLESFSEQQLVDCAKGIYLNMGCNGGNPLWAFRYLKSHYMELESEYPYFSGTTKSGGTCQYKEKSKTSVEVQSDGAVTPKNVAQMKAALAVQPISVLVEADKSVFQTYKSGVLNSSACGTQLDHAVLAVGYGSEGGQEYWLVKNSWNTTWGDQGYIKLAITGDDAGTCGVQSGPTHATTN